MIIVEQNVGVLPSADQALMMEKGAWAFDGRGAGLEETGELRRTYLGETADAHRLALSTGWVGALVRSKQRGKAGRVTTTAQGWVLLGILGVLSTGLLTLTSLALTGLRSEMAARFSAVDQRFDGVAQRFDGVDRRLEALDHDVQALTDRVFRDRP